MKQKIFSLVLIVIGIIGIIAVIALIFEFKIETEVASQVQSSDSQVQSQPNKLKTYRNVKYGYEFKYPVDYTVTADNRDGGPQFYRTPSQTFWITTAFLSRDGKLPDIAIPRAGTAPTEKINGHVWQKHQNASGYRITYSLSENNLAIAFSVRTDSEESTLWEVLSTFKFVELPYERLAEVFYDLKKGTRFGSLTVNRILSDGKMPQPSPDDATIYYDGQITLTGDYEIRGDIEGEIMCVGNFDDKSIASLPQLDHSFDYHTIDICVRYNVLAQSEFPAKAGRATVVFKNVKQVLHYDEHLFYAELVRVE